MILNRVMITAANTMAQLQKQMDTIANNLANVQTAGYKQRRATFGEMMVQEINNQPDAGSEIGRKTPDGIRQGVGAKVAQIQMNPAQGTVSETGRLLDFAFTVQNQYFKVLGRDGNTDKIYYTRNGAFYLSPTGENEMMLVTAAGNPVLDENNNPILFRGEMKNLELTPGGRFIYTDEDGNRRTVALGVVEAENPQLFLQAGDNLLVLPDHLTEAGTLTVLHGADRGRIGLRQRALEQSNVDLTEEMTSLLQTQRAYQFQARAITLADQMQGLINGIR
jgi:fagellar hook-basal body proteins